MGRRRLAKGALEAALVALILAGTLLAADGPPAPPVATDLIVVAVLPFGGTEGECIGPEKITFMFERKLARVDDFILVEPISVQSLVRRARIDVTTVDDKTVAALMASPLGANYCLRGTITPKGKAVTLKIRVLEAMAGSSAETPIFNVWFDRTFELEHFRDVPPVVRQMVLDMAGLTEKPERIVDQIIGENIVPNGDFETADKTGKDPAHWGPMDGLSVFWVDEPGRGKVLRVETDVIGDQWESWRKQLAAGARPEDAPKKLPWKPPGYNTIAGSRGVAVFNEYLLVKPGQAYLLSYDCKGHGGKVFIKGYSIYESKAITHKREVWRAYKAMRPKTPGEWEHYSRVIHPTERIKQVKWIRVMLFPYWPPGTYFFDNVKIVPVSEKEIPAARAYER